MSKGSMIAIIAGIVIAAAIGIGVAAMSMANPNGEAPSGNNGNVTPTTGKNYTVNLNEDIKFTTK